MVARGLQDFLYQPCAVTYTVQYRSMDRPNLSHYTIIMLNEFFLNQAEHLL